MAIFNITLSIGIGVQHFAMDLAVPPDQEPTNAIPVASFDFEIENLTVTLTDTSIDEDGTIVAWNWNFGDGPTSSDQNPVHTYAAGGSYTVALQVTDNSGGTSDPVSTSISVVDPDAIPVASFTHAENFLVVTFTDTSTDAFGTINGWAWDFGDGHSSTEQNPVHTYAVAGTYTVTLQVTDDQGASSSVVSGDVTVTAANIAPVASFTRVKNNLQVTFTDTSTDADGTVASWAWNFGDGNLNTTQNPVHTYAMAGTYHVTLQVTDNDGAASNLASKNVTVTSGGGGNQAPVAEFTTSQNGVAVQFTDASTDDGTIVSWLWDFGDGNTSTDQNPLHFYAAAGNYAVSLTVTDDGSLTDNMSMNVTVAFDDTSITLHDYTVTVPHLTSFPTYVVFMNDIEVNERIGGHNDLNDFMTRNGFTNVTSGTNWVYSIAQTELLFDKMIISQTIGNAGGTQYSFVSSNPHTSSRASAGNIYMLESDSAYKTIEPEVYISSMEDSGYSSGLNPCDVLSQPFKRRVELLRFTQYNFSHPNDRYAHIGSGSAVGNGNGYNYVNSELIAGGKDPNTFNDGVNTVNWVKDFKNEFAAFCASKGLGTSFIENLCTATNAEMIQLLHWFTAAYIYHGPEDSLKEVVDKYYPGDVTDYVAKQNTNIPLYRAIQAFFKSVFEIPPPWTVTPRELTWIAAINAMCVANGWAAPLYQARIYLHPNQTKNPITWDTVDYVANIGIMNTWLNDGMPASIDSFFALLPTLICNIHQWAVSSFDDADSPRYKYFECLFTAAFYNKLLYLNRDTYNNKVVATWDTVKKAMHANSTTNVNYYAMEQMGWLFPQAGESSVLNDSLVVGVDGLTITPVVRSAGGTTYKCFQITNLENITKHVDHLYDGFDELTDGMVFTIHNDDLTDGVNYFKIGRQGGTIEVPKYGIVLVVYVV